MSFLCFIRLSPCGCFIFPYINKQLQQSRLGWTKLLSENWRGSSTPCTKRVWNTWFERMAECVAVHRNFILMLAWPGFLEVKSYEHLKPLDFTSYSYFLPWFSSVCSVLYLSSFLCLKINDFLKEGLNAIMLTTCVYLIVLQHPLYHHRSDLAAVYFSDGSIPAVWRFLMCTSDVACARVLRRAAELRLSNQHGQ